MSSELGHTVVGGEGRTYSRGQRQFDGRKTREKEDAENAGSWARRSLLKKMTVTEESAPC